MFRLINYTNSRHALFDHRCYSPEDGGGSGDAAAAAAAKAKADADAAVAAKAEVDRLAAIEANKNKPTDAEAALLKDVMAKKKKLDEAAATNADLAAKLAAFDGIDPVAIKAMLDANKVAEKEALQKAGDFERLKKMMAEEHAAEIAKVKKTADEAAAAVASSNSKINDLTIGQAFSTSKFVTDDLVLPATKARALYGANFEIEGDKVVAYDKPKGEAERTKLVDGSGSPLSFEESIKRIVEGDPDKDRLLKSKLATGANSGGVKIPAVKVASDGLKGVSRIQASLEAQKAAKK